MDFGHCNLTGAYCVYPPILSSDNAKKRAMTDELLAGVIAVIIALSAAMFLGLYRWSQYSPVFASDSGAMVLPDHTGGRALSV
jgi:hypothetical protein